MCFYLKILLLIFINVEELTETMQVVQKSTYFSQYHKIVNILLSQFDRFNFKKESIIFSRKYMLY